MLGRCTTARLAPGRRDSNPGPLFAERSIPDLRTGHPDAAPPEIGEGAARAVERRGRTLRTGRCVSRGPTVARTALCAKAIARCMPRLSEAPLFHVFVSTPSLAEQGEYGQIAQSGGGAVKLGRGRAGAGGRGRQDAEPDRKVREGRPRRPRHGNLDHGHGCRRGPHGAYAEQLAGVYPVAEPGRRFNGRAVDFTAVKFDEPCL